MKDFLLKAYVKVQIFREDHGQDLIEYALIGALLALAAVASMQTLATSINGVYQRIQAGLDAAAPAA